MDPHADRFDRDALEALTRWDELTPEVLDQLATHPIHGEELRHLQRAETWLWKQAESASGGAPAPQANGTAADACPAPDELYDYGRGPGYAPLALDRRTEIDAHVLHCLDCEVLVESLAQRPPAPLLEAAPTTDEPEAPVASPRGRLYRLRPLVPALIAASIVTAVVLVVGEPETEAGGFGLPAAPLLRGETQDPLYFPRELLLAPPSEVDLPDWIDLAELRRFEVETVPDAEQYRLELFGHLGGAFDEGRRMARHAGSEPVTSLASVLDTPLPTGHYTWQAWAVVRDLEQRLGARDFEVVANEDLWRRIVRLLGEDPAEPEAIATAVRLLHEHGFETDARALARALPPSSERDAYLSRRPGR